jgi:hypothetical protein
VRTSSSTTTTSATTTASPEDGGKRKVRFHHVDIHPFRTPPPYSESQDDGPADTSDPFRSVGPSSTPSPFSGGGDDDELGANGEPLVPDHM